MSIAVTARVAPSRFVLGSMAMICGAVVFLGILYALSFSGYGLPVLIRLSLGCASIVAGVFGLYILYISNRVAWVQICIDGRILLAFEDIAQKQTTFPSMKAQTAHLLPHSTLLPYVMLWRLKRETGHVVSLLILPGVVTPEIFRALSLASHQIAGSQPFG